MLIEPNFMKLNLANDDKKQEMYKFLLENNAKEIHMVSGLSIFDWNIPSITKRGDESSWKKLY